MLMAGNLKFNGIQTLTISESRLRSQLPTATLRPEISARNPCLEAMAAQRFHLLETWETWETSQMLWRFLILWSWHFLVNKLLSWPFRIRHSWSSSVSIRRWCHEGWLQGARNEGRASSAPGVFKVPQPSCLGDFLCTWTKSVNGSNSRATRLKPCPSPCF